MIVIPTHAAPWLGVLHLSVETAVWKGHVMLADGIVATGNFPFIQKTCLLQQIYLLDLFDIFLKRAVMPMSITNDLTLAYRGNTAF